MLPPKGVLIQLTSYTFLFAFLPVTLLVYWLLPRTVWRLAFLVLASWVFVGWFDWRFVPIMVGATTVDWVAGLLIARAGAETARRRILVVALVANVAILGYFKYRGFFLDSLDGLGSWAGLDLDLPALHVLLPLGISFYTFSAMSYVIDVYRGDVTATRSFLRYAAFIALFPRHRRADPALARRRAHLRGPAAPPDHAPCGARPLLHRLRHGQEAARRRRHAAARRPTLRQCRPPPLLQRVGGRAGLHPPALLRLQRLLGHGRRHRLPAGLPLPAELRLAVQGGQPRPVLAPLAHDALLLDARLPVHPTRRLAARHGRSRCAT